MEQLEQENKKGWLKENWFKFGVLIILLIVSLAGVYLYNQSIQDRKARQLEQDRQSNTEKCQKIGNDFTKKYPDSINEVIGLAPSQSRRFLSPQFHYNTKMKTCLILIGYLNTWVISGKLYTEKVLEIHDLYANALLLNTAISSSPDNTNTDSPTAGTPSDEFQKQAEKLMSE